MVYYSVDGLRPSEGPARREVAILCQVKPSEVAKDGEKFVFLVQTTDGLRGGYDAASCLTQAIFLPGYGCEKEMIFDNLECVAPMFVYRPIAWETTLVASVKNPLRTRGCATEW